ncbi:hypothetical protein [Streptomyces sp. NPDC002122]|uniref:hypothetical protein n=1 Tax=Streptomyces sp. NPDC002122 TaxID=3154407 RepID=UPI0033219B99
MNIYGIHYNDAKGQHRYTEFNSSLSHSDMEIEVIRARSKGRDVTFTDDRGEAFSIPTDMIRSIKEL